MGLEYHRVAEIWVPETGDRGTGYLLCDGCLLTAFHVVKGHGLSGINFRTLGQYEIDPNQWVETQNLVWKNEHYDLAIFQFKPQSRNFQEIPWIKSIQINSEITCLAQGFPRFRERTDEITNESIFHPYLANGTIVWQANPKKPGELLIDIKGGTPESMENWKGFSGAALFSDDGYLLGVVIQGPKELGGTQLEAIALETVINQDKSLNDVLQKHFQKELYCKNSPDGSEDIDIYELELKLKNHKLRRIDVRYETTDLDTQIEELEDQIKEHQQRGGNQAVSPKKQLLELLTAIEKTLPGTFWAAWSECPAKHVRTNKSEKQDLNNAYIRLMGLNDEKSLIYFLAQIYSDLQKSKEQGEQFKTPLRELALKICQSDIAERNVVPLSMPSETQLLEQAACWLIKIDDKDPLNSTTNTYEVTSWLIKDRNIYQDQLDEDGIPIHDLQNFSHKVINAESFTISIRDPITHSRDFKEQLSSMLSLVWENEELDLEQLEPEVIFFVSKALIGIDFETISLGGGFILGNELPISVSLWERYQKTPSLRRARNYWIDRWKSFQTYNSDSFRSFVEIYDHHPPQSKTPLDLTCPIKLRTWIKKQDKARSRKVIGLGFYSFCQGFKEVLDNLTFHGLSIMIWPQESLDEAASKDFEDALKFPANQLSRRINDYRLDHSDDDGLPYRLSLWIDNPYLPPPDSDFLKS